MKAILITVSVPNGIKTILPGWVVSDTDELFAVDQRYEADLQTSSPAEWAITHLPTGFRVEKGPWTDAWTRAQAIKIAQGFYREAVALGWDLTSTRPNDIAIAHNRMSREEREAFWMRVAVVPVVTNRMLGIDCPDCEDSIPHTHGAKS